MMTHLPIRVCWYCLNLLRRLTRWVEHQRYKQLCSIGLGTQLLEGARVCNFRKDPNAISIGKDLSISKNIPINIFVKPELLNALPNYSKSVWYFALELGVCFKLTKEK